MITQMLLDGIAQFGVEFIQAIPPMSPEFYDALAKIAAGGVWLASVVTKLGVIIPFDAVAGVIQWWASVLLFWGGMLVSRLVLWIIGR